MRKNHGRNEPPRKDAPHKGTLLDLKSSPKGAESLPETSYASKAFQHAEVSGEGTEEGNPKGDYEAEETLIEIAYRLCKAKLQATAAGGPKTVTVGEGIAQTEWKTLGIENEDFDEAAENLVQRLIQMTAEEQVDLMKRLWDEEYRDFQYLVLNHLKEATIPLSRNLGFEKLFELYRHCIITRSGTDTVDELAMYHLNALAYLEPPETWPVMDKWIMENDEPWLQRAALFHQISMGSYCNKERLFQYCEKFFGMHQNTKGFDLRMDAIEKALEKYAQTGDTNDSATRESKATADVIEFIDKNKRSMSEEVGSRLMKLRRELDTRKKSKKKKRSKLSALIRPLNM